MILSVHPWLMMLPLAASSAFAEATAPPWTSFDDSAWGGRSAVERFSTDDCTPMPASLTDPVAREALAPEPLPGCGRVVADVDQVVGLATPVPDGLQRYRSVLASVASETVVAMCLRSTLDDATPLACSWIETGSKAQWITAPMPIVEGPAAPARWLTFEVVDARPVSLAVDAVTLSERPLRGQAEAGCSVGTTRHNPWLGLLGLLLLMRRNRLRSQRPGAMTHASG